MFKSSISPPIGPGGVVTYCCVQFLVSKERVHLRPQSWYEDALQFWRSEQSYQLLFPTNNYINNNEVKGRHPCQLGMYTWHVIFGEELTLPRRERDPRLPLGMKWINPELEYVHSGDIPLNVDVTRQGMATQHLHSMAAKAGVPVT